MLKINDGLSYDAAHPDTTKLSIVLSHGSW